MANALEIDITELVTGTKSTQGMLSHSRYRLLAIIASELTSPDFPLSKESRRLAILSILFDILGTEYMNDDGTVREKFLLKNATMEMRQNYVRILRCEREFADEIFQDYVNGKSELDVLFKKLEDQIEERKFKIEIEEEKKKD